LSRSDKPTVDLVHGAFADASSFARIILELIARGLNVVVPAVPNRSLLGDSAYVASIVRPIPGPVVLVGHSYGGAVITVAGVEDNVTALVYLAATPWRRAKAWSSSREASPTPTPPARSPIPPSRSRAPPLPAPT
jgi:pimeloyl-ACP methyl ester carboxylesterase